MSIALVFTNKQPDEWLAALKKNLPNTLLEVYPNITKPDEVEFALCWKPKKNALLEFPNLKMIHSTGAGVDHIINTQKIKEDQILCRVVDEHLSNDMYEFVLAVILGHLKNLPTYFENQSQKKWEPSKYKTINETVVCVLGLGEIGTYLAKKLSSMGFKVKGWALNKKEIDGVACFTEKDLDKAVTGADFLVNVLPLTSKTENILNQELLMKLNKGSVLINVGRGEHLEEQELLAILDTEHLAEAYLDVFRNEPLPIDHPFWTHPKIRITPHIASITNINSAVLLVVNNFMNFKNGKALQHQITLKKGY